MQYLLTEQEYNALRQEQRLQARASQEELQAFCTQAAMHIPVVVEWRYDKTPRPWGCILGPREQDPGYCDRCPAKAVCPHPHKEWSK